MTGWMTSALTRVLGVLALAAIAVLGIKVVSLEHALSVREKTIQKDVERQATDLGAAVGAPSRDLEPALPPSQRNVLRKLQAVSPDVKPVERVAATAEVTGNVTLGPTEHRFTLSPDCLTLHRDEKFSFDAVILTGVDGTVRVANVAVTELDPATGLTISDASSSPKIVTHFSFVKETPPAPPVFHPRAVAGIGYAGGGPLVGGGLELLNGERFGGAWAHMNVSILALYDTQKKTATGAGVLGFRPFNWNISVGPAYFFPNGAVGAAATIELTR